MTEEVRWVQQRLPKFPKQANSADLIRHRKYDRCVVCEDRKAITSNIVWMDRWQKQGDQVVQLTAEAVATKWWTCLKCEEGTK